MTAGPPLTWNLVGRTPAEIALATSWPRQVTAEEAWGGSTGAGVRVCVVDSGIEDGHPLVGRVTSAHVARRDGDGGHHVVPDPDGDACGHGTACAGIIRSVAPGCELHSVRVLDSGFAGSGDALVTGVRWALEQGFDVVNLSLSTTRHTFAGQLRELADHAYFRGTLLVASAHNMPVESFPWRFSSVLSVGSHQDDDPDVVLYNPSPPVEFFARGSGVTVAWPGGGTSVCTGNSFAAPHVAGRCALILAKHPGLKPFQVKDLLMLTSDNVRGHR
ncbi:S8 family serine peptidase [Streptomyces sp. TRM 70351]|uniref:S8 family peptidase n=1 Tax=Streptomyces sp. TRM 70351 TaxID=3116552 RepID=UPI002E7BB142|nr:S8 family serine peptidase [Streptomyces sp. TRM 70351]MEE1928287.1 S8 family serine peptidase [Streptomyces sp. TRM 70351]